MKNPAGVYLLALLFLSTSCNFNEKNQEEVVEIPEVEFDMEAAEKELRELCILETQLFIDGESSAHLFWQNPNTQVIQKSMITHESVYWVKGGETRIDGYNGYFENNPDFEFQVTDRTDWVVEVTPEMAFVTYVQDFLWQENPEAEVLPFKSLETRVFKRDQDQWKIALTTTSAWTAARESSN